MKFNLQPKKPFRSLAKGISRLNELTYLWAFCLLLLLSSNGIMAQNVSVNVKDAPLESVLKDVAKQANHEVFYSQALLKKAKPVTINVKKTPLKDVLKLIFANQSLKFTIANQTIVISAINDENGTGLIQVHGRVINDRNVPFPGVNIWILGTRIGAVTDFDGNFDLYNVPADGIVEASGLTIETKKVAVDGQADLRIVAKEKVSEMKEIVVNNGYQKIAKERSTGSMSVITSEDLDKVPASNVMHQLEGQVAGLAIDVLDSDNSFVYGNISGDAAGKTSYNFKIRGQSTYQSNSMPLIILDGTPTELDIRTLNPKDIDKITFLKDAAAASIYGARSANGVMVVETKRGKIGKTRISASQNYGISNKASLSSLPLMNSSQILNLEQELVDKNIISDPALASSLNYGANPITQGMELMFQEKRGTITTGEKKAQLDILRTRNNYSQIEDNFMQASETNNYALNISGGDKDYSYFTSASFSKEKTSSVGNVGKRMTFTANQDFKLFNYVKVNTSLKGSFFNYKQNGLGLSPIGASLTTFMPYDQILDENGGSVSYYRRFYSTASQNLENQGYLPWTYNYIDEQNNSDKNVKEQNYSANISLTMPLLKGLDAVATYYIENSNLDNRIFYNQDTYYTRDVLNYATYLDANTGELTHGIPLGGIYQGSRYNKSSYTGRGQLNYNTIINNKHSIDALGGIEFRQVRDMNQAGNLFGYNDKSQTSIDLPSNTYNSVFGYSSSSSYNNTLKDQRRRFLSYYGNAAYTFDNKYTISGSARLDDYNNFGVDKSYRRTPLWSTGLKWNISKEDFMNDVTAINSLSLRASYGYNGNISLTTYPFTNISLANVDYFSQQPYAFINAAANPALRWEKTGILNFGLDFSLFDYRLHGTIEYYEKESKDLIQDFPVSPFYGLPNSSLTRNTATLESHGIDLNLTGVVLKTKDFNLDLTMVTSYNTNEVTDSRYTNYSSYLNGTGSTPPIIGYGLNSVFAFRSAGLNSTGSVQVFDKEGNIVQSNTPLTDIEDMKYIGTRTPKYYGSLSANLSYKKLSLYFLATYKLDYVLFKPTFENYISRYGGLNKYDLNSDIDQRWRVAGDEATTNVPGVSGMAGYSYSRYIFSDERIIDGDHIRFKEISLSYDFSDLFANTFIQGASLTCSARNIGMIWRKNKEGLDPDFLPVTGTSMKIPPTALYSMGFNFNF